VSFSFSQEDKSRYAKNSMKVNSVAAVDYINTNLKLDSKQKAIVMNAYAEYAANMIKAHAKTGTKKGKDGNARTKDMLAKKELNKYVMRFSVKRDEMVKKCLKKRQIVKYNDLIRSINPHTLQVKKIKK